MLVSARIVWYRRVPSPSLLQQRLYSSNPIMLQRQQDRNTPQKQADKQENKQQEPKKAEDDQSHKAKLMPKSDEEIRERLEQMLGSDGGLAGVELEGGKAVGLKRHVKGNMFRLI